MDFNVARKGNKIVEPFKIETHQETIDYLIQNVARVVCTSHISEEWESFAPVAKQIVEIIQWFSPIKSQFLKIQFFEFVEQMKR